MGIIMIIEPGTRGNPVPDDEEWVDEMTSGERTSEKMVRWAQKSPRHPSLRHWPRLEPFLVAFAPVSLIPGLFGDSVEFASFKDEIWNDGTRASTKI